MKFFILAISTVAFFTSVSAQSTADSDSRTLRKLLRQNQFTGKVEDTLSKRMGRPIDQKKAELGKLIFFDKGVGLHKSNSCAGCHSPTNGWGDTQSIAIGIQNNDVVGLGREGPRNQRRTPTIANTAFFPVLMWNGRFSSASGDPFNNSKGYVFPPPEGEGLFFPKDPRFNHLLVAQAHIPFTELPEMAGFTGAVESGAFDNCTVILPKNIPFRANIKSNSARGLMPAREKLLESGDSPNYCQFDDAQGSKLPVRFPDTGVLNSPIRHEVLRQMNLMAGYRSLFAALYPEVEKGNAIEFWMIGQALAEFQIQETYAKAPIDKFAAGDDHALSAKAMRGAVTFFGKAQCVSCHSVKGPSNEMFSDFKMHNAGIPQIAPQFGKVNGKTTGNVAFRNLDGSMSTNGKLDLGQFEFLDKQPETKFKFRTSPLRNVSLQPAFFHNGAFTKLSDAVKYHLDTLNLAKTYDPAAAGLPSDLQKALPDPTDTVLKTLAPQLAKPIKLTETEVADLVTFLAEGLLDPRAKPEALMGKIPTSLPSGAKLPIFKP